MLDIVIGKVLLIDNMEMIEKYLISIIIPIYNVEEYVELCVLSVINQSYKFLEIILVDDGSTDRSGIICDQLAGRDRRIRVIHKINEGLSSARNAGIEIATGDYIGFVDGDDVVCSDMFLHLYNNMLTLGSDMSVCAYDEFFDVSEIHTEFDFEKIECFGPEEYMKMIIDCEGVFESSPSVWRRLYKRSLMVDILFPKGRCYEDLVWSFKVISRCNKIAITNLKLYLYRQRNTSITKDSLTCGINEKMIVDRPLAHKELSYWLKTNGYNGMSDEVRFQYVRMLLDYYCRVNFAGKTDLIKYKSVLIRSIREEVGWMKEYVEGEIDIQRKLVLQIAMHSPRFFSFIWYLSNLRNVHKAEKLCNRVVEKD